MYERIYTKLTSIVDLEKLIERRHLKYKSGGFMDLNFDYLGKEDENSFRIAMAHNFIQNGDLMCDPDMEIRIIPTMEMAEALTFQQDASPRLIFKKVYSEDDGKSLVNIKIKKDLNLFLDQWLSNIKIQNFSIEND